MKLELKRNLTVKKFTSYLKLMVHRERVDIQNYLFSYDPNTNDKVKINVHKYLEKKGVLKNNQITTLGQELVSTGNIWEEEEGKYILFCILDDQLIGSRPLKIERVAPDRKNDNIVSEGILEKNLLNQCFMLTQAEYTMIKISEMSIYKEEEYNTDTPILIWRIDDSSSTYEISNNYVLPSPIENINLTDLIDELFQINHKYGAWDSVTNKLRTDFDNTKMDLMTDFSYPVLNLSTKHFSKGQFQSAKIFNTPVMPKDTYQAELWRNWLLKREFIDDYQNIYNIENICHRLSAKEEFIEFNLNYSIENLMHNFFNDVRDASFWHFFAPIDLDPQMKIKVTN